MVKETVSIRVDPKSKAALDMVSAELSLQKDGKVTLSEAIWHLVTKAAPHIGKRIEELTDEGRNRTQ